MCQLCVEAVKHYFPALHGKAVSDLLLAATGFPCVDALTAVRQVAEAHDAGCRTVSEVSAYADSQLEQKAFSYSYQDSGWAEDLDIMAV